MERMHCTCVAIDHLAVLLRGGSGSGKSDLALRLIDRGGRLVADDYVEIRARDGVLWARAPEAIAGLLEVRGLGVMRLPYQGRAQVGAVVDLVAPEDVPRLPDPEHEIILDVAVRRVRLAAFVASTPAKLRLLVRELEADVLRRA